MEERKSTERGCSACPGCPTNDLTGDGQRKPSLAGWRLVGVSVGLFLGPLVLAIVGAALSGPGGGWQLFGALVGLAAGMAVSVVAARLLMRPSKENG